MNVKLKRTIQEWRNLDPVNIAQRQGRPVAKHALVDAKHDILALAARVEELAAPAVQGEPVECSVCRGKGYRVAPFDIVLTCPHCQGSGKCPAPQPAEQQPAPDVAALVEALSESLKGIEIPSVLTPARAEFFKAGVHAAVNQLNTVLAAHRSQGGEK